MDKELEAKFFIDDKEETRRRLTELGFAMTKPETLMRRKTYHSKTDKYGWARVRDEGDRVTMTYKRIKGSGINDVEEAELTISDFDKGGAFIFLVSNGRYTETSYQENYREIWKKSGVEVVIDTWPQLQPYIEIEAASADIVKQYSGALGFDFDKAKFGSVDVFYKEVYGIPTSDFIAIPKIVFDPNQCKAFSQKLQSYASQRSCGT